MSTFHIITLGCKINIYESESINNILTRNGFVEEKFPEKADIIIINSCTVTSKADSKCRNIIRSVRKNNKNALLVITGCMVEAELDQILNLNSADVIVMNRNKDKIIDAILLAKNYNNKPFIYSSSSDGSFNFKNTNFSSHSRAFLKIQDGCNNRCSYCRIPYVRGESRSRNFENILEEIELLIKNGYEEIVLTGINLGSYKTEKMNFYDLLYLLLNKYKNIRFRLSSIEPEYIDTRLANLLNFENFCPHFHVPLQSGSNKILALMNRKYNLDEYYEKIDILRKIKPDCFISTDLIVGFPQESDEDFASTYEFVKKIKFSFIHLFTYSPREGTLSFSLKGKVPDFIVKERIIKLKNLVKQLNYEYRKNFLGKTLEMLVERKINNRYTGKSENYLDLELESNSKIELSLKKRYKVKLEKISDNKNLCSLIT